MYCFALAFLGTLTLAVWFRRSPFFLALFLLLAAAIVVLAAFTHNELSQDLGKGTQRRD